MNNNPNDTRTKKATKNNFKWILNFVQVWNHSINWIVIRFMSSAIVWNHWLWMGSCFASFTSSRVCAYVASNSLFMQNTSTSQQRLKYRVYEEFALHVRYRAKSIDFDDFTELQRSIGLTTEDTRTKQQQTITVNRFYFVNTNTIDSSPVKTHPNAIKFFLLKTQQNKQEYDCSVCSGVCIYYPLVTQCLYISLPRRYCRRKM